MGISIRANNFPIVPPLGNNYVFEPLCMKPGLKQDPFTGTGSTRSRYFLVWNGLGRYKAGTLKIWKKGVALRPGTDFTEESNGVFYNFVGSAIPAATDKYTDYLIGYQVREGDLAFGQGTDPATQGESYFMFPNWLEFGYLGSAFWYGKYLASQTGNGGSAQGGTSNVPKSVPDKDPWVSITKTNASAYSAAKTASAVTGSQFHLGKNAEWCNIAYWCAHMDLYPAGNSASGVDGMGVAGVTTADGRTRTGSGPVTWNHNLQANGITDMVGNVWEWQDDVELRSGVLWFPSYSGTSTAISNQGVSFGTGYSNSSIQNSLVHTGNAKWNGIPAFGSGTYITVKGNDACWSSTGTRVLLRGGSYPNGASAGLLAFSVLSAASYTDVNYGFRLAATIGTE